MSKRATARSGRRSFLKALAAGAGGSCLFGGSWLRAATLPADEQDRLLKETQPAMTYDGGDFLAWQQRARKTLVDLLGMDPLEDERTFEPELLWEREFPFGKVQSIVLRGGDELSDIPMYWCLPADYDGEAELPVMICLQGHNQAQKRRSLGLEDDERTLDENVAGDRDIGRQALQRGYAALCIDQRGFADRGDGCQHMAMRALMLGRSLVADRVADVNLAIRWLGDQPEADLSRIGIMGNSGGGTTAIYAVGLLDSIHLAAPSCSFGRLRDTWFAGSRCTCAYVPRILQKLDLPDVLALHAPSPVVVVGGEDDYHAPGPAVRAAFEDLRERYAAAGAAEQCRLVVGPEGHRFYADLAWPEIEALL